MGILKKLFPILLLILTSCNKTYEVNIQFDYVAGIKKGTPVTIDGFNIGKVVKNEYHNSRTITTVLEIDNDVALYSDDTFKVDEVDILGEKNIIVSPGKSGQLLDRTQVIIGIPEDRPLPPDSLGMEIGGFLKNIFNKDRTTNDSILIELRRLNENLEKLENK